MSCKWGTEISLIFQKSGLTTYPSEIDFRTESGRYDHTRVKYSEAGGQTIARIYEEAEPATVQFAGNPAFRVYVPSDAITFRRQLDRPTTAELTLMDPIQVLNRGTITKSLQSTTLRNAVDYVFKNRNDPNDVLTGYRFMDSADADETRANITASLVPAVAEGVQYVYDFIDGTDPESLFTGFEWDGASPLEALADILKEFNLDYRVETDGTLVIGTHGVDGDVFLISAPEAADFTLSRYDVTTSANQTNSVRVRGSYSNIRARNSSGGQAPSQKLQPFAEATATGLSGDALELEAKGVGTLTGLRDIAKQALVQEVMGDVNGSLTIDPLASPDPSKLANLDVGNHLVIDPSVSEHCPGNVVTGVFVVNSIHHKASPTRGWRTTVDVSQVVFPEEVVVKTFYYDPATDQRFDSLESYNEFTQDALGDDAFLPIDFS